MQKSKKQNKTNISLSGSRRQLKTYLQRYKQKSQNGAKSSSTLYSKQQTSLTAQVSQSEHMFQQISLDSDIKIQQQIDDYQNMTQYLQAEKMWISKINQIKNEINEIRQGVKAQQKNIKQMEKDIASKRNRLSTLEEKLEKSKETLQIFTPQNYDDLIENYQTEYDQIHQIGQKSIAQARLQYEQLQQQNDKLDIELKQIEQQFQKRPLAQSQKYNVNLTSLLEQQQQLKIQLAQIESQTSEVVGYIRQLELQRPIRQQVHRQYLQLYQRMFINQQLDVMSELINYKNRQIERMEDYTKRKIKYRQKRAQIQEIQNRIVTKKQIINKLQQDIRDCSTKLLNLYQMEL